MRVEAMVAVAMVGWGCEPAVVGGSDLQVASVKCVPGRAGLQFPTPGATKVAWAANPALTLLDGDPSTWLATPTFELFDDEGEPVPSTSVSDGGTVELFPRDLLRPATTYTVRWFDGCESRSWTFTTQVSTSPADPLALQGQAWLLDYPGRGRIDLLGDAAQLGELLRDVVPPIAIWFAIDDDGTLTVQRQFVQRGSEVPSACQDGPGPSIPAEPQPDGSIHVPLPDLAYRVTSDGGSVDVSGRTLTVLFGPDGSRPLLVEERATVDIANDALSDVFPTEDACELLTTFGAACEPCDDGSQTCLRVVLVVDDIVPLQGFQPQVVTAETSTCRHEASF